MITKKITPEGIMYVLKAGQIYYEAHNIAQLLAYIRQAERSYICTNIS